ncbi:NADH dehydrogenase (ubiquinone) complex I, assembly factor 6 [Balamuthia mandrillaris]
MAKNLLLSACRTNRPGRALPRLCPVSSSLTFARHYNTTASEGVRSETSTKGASEERTPPPSFTPERIRANQQFCLDRVKRLDYEHYLSIFFLPKQARSANMAIRAFNAETAVIPDAVKDKNAASMRLHWWKETINACLKGAPTNNPVIEELYRTTQTGTKLSYSWFKRTLDKRLSDLASGSVIHSMTAMESFAEDTASSLLYLSLESLDVRNIQADHAASHIGKAVGITRLLRGTPYHFQRGETYLPLDLLAKKGIVQNDLYRGEIPAAITDVVYEVACVAKAHLTHARQLRPNVPQQAIPALLPALIAEDYLQRLEKTGFNPFDPSLLSLIAHNANTLPLLFRMLAHSWRNQY